MHAPIRFLGVTLSIYMFSLGQDALAQHHHHHGVHQHWTHVIPHHHHHRAWYYTHNGTNYYTTAPVPVVPADGQISTYPPVMPQSTKLEFGSFQQASDLLGRLDFELNRWCLDMHYNYQENADFSALYRDAYGLLATIKQMRTANYLSNRELVKQDIARVDTEFHRVQKMVQSLTSSNRRLVPDGNLAAKSSVVEAVLHHLAFDVGVTPQHDDQEEQAPPPADGAAPPAPGA